jgi:hypothetical protein
MDRNTAVIALMGQLSGTVIILTSLVIWWSRKKQQQNALPPDGLRRIEARLSEMQQALDTVAVEVERISEAQRFTTKLLAERAPEAVHVGGASRVAESSPVRR